MLMLIWLTTGLWSFASVLFFISTMGMTRPTYLALCAGHWHRRHNSVSHTVSSQWRFALPVLCPLDPFEELSFHLFWLNLHRSSEVSSARMMINPMSCPRWLLLFISFRFYFSIDIKIFIQRPHIIFVIIH